MKNIFKDKKNIFILFAVITLFIVSLSLINVEMQNDTFYDIKLGEYIVKNGIDFKDHFSFIPNLKYTYPHWLFDILVYLIYNPFGFKGLLIGEFILTFAISLTMFFATRYLTKNDSISYIVSIFMLSFLNRFITVRTQMISFLILLLMLFIIELSREKKKKRYLVYLIILSIILANTHCATYPVAIVLFLPYLVSDLIYFIKKKKTKKSGIIEIEECKNTKFIITEFISVILCGFLSISGGAYTYIYLILKSRCMTLITEHAPSSIVNNPFIYLFMGLFLVILLSKNMKIKLKDLFLIGGFTLLSLLSIRSFALFLLLTAFSFARLSCTIESNYLKHIKVNDIFYKNKFLICALIYILIITIPSIYEKTTKEYISKEEYPVEMVKYIKSNLDYNNMRIYNHFEHGSYLILNDIKVFIDTRTDLYLKEFNRGIEVFNDDEEIKYEFDKIDKKYNYTHYLVRNNHILKRILDLRSDIVLIKEDEYHSLYMKISTNV